MTTLLLLILIAIGLRIALDQAAIGARTRPAPPPKRGYPFHKRRWF